MVSNSQTKILKYAIDFGALTNPGYRAYRDDGSKPKFIGYANG